MAKKMGSKSAKKRAVPENVDWPKKALDIPKDALVEDVDKDIKAAIDLMHKRAEESRK